jgi:hypothetical protein
VTGAIPPGLSRAASEDANVVLAISPRRTSTTREAEYRQERWCVPPPRGTSPCSSIQRGRASRIPRPTSLMGTGTSLTAEARPSVVAGETERFGRSARRRGGVRPRVDLGGRALVEDPGLRSRRPWGRRAGAARRPPTLAQRHRAASRRRAPARRRPGVPRGIPARIDRHPVVGDAAGGRTPDGSATARCRRQNDPHQQATSLERRPRGARPGTPRRATRSCESPRSVQDSARPTTVPTSPAMDQL